MNVGDALLNLKDKVGEALGCALEEGPCGVRCFWQIEFRAYISGRKESNGFFVQVSYLPENWIKVFISCTTHAPEQSFSCTLNFGLEKGMGTESIIDNSAFSDFEKTVLLAALVARYIKNLASREADWILIPLYGPKIVSAGPSSMFGDDRDPFADDTL